jgi:hypothetical protein
MRHGLFAAHPWLVLVAKDQVTVTFDRFADLRTLDVASDCHLDPAFRNKN